MITPLAGPDQVDVAALERLIEHLIDGGVHGLFLLGSCGEGPSLGAHCRRELVDRTCSQVAGRIPILVGITDTAASESVALAEHAARAGADALVCSAPYYFPIDQEDLAGYFTRLVPRLPLPVLLYNIPSMTRVSFAVSTLRRLTELHGIIGIKDSSDDSAYFAKLMHLHEHRPDWRILVGSERLLAETVERGGDGGINGGANVLPELFVALYRAVIDGDADRRHVLQQRVIALDRIYRVGVHPVGFIQGIKSALSHLGICGEQMAEPLAALSPEQRRTVAATLDELEALGG